MRLTFSVRDTRDGKVYTHVEEFHGESVHQRIAAVSQTHLESLIDSPYELIVLHISKPL